MSSASAAAAPAHSTASAAAHALMRAGGRCIRFSQCPGIEFGNRLFHGAGRACYHPYASCFQSAVSIWSYVARDYHLDSILRQPLGGENPCAE